MNHPPLSATTIETLLDPPWFVVRFLEKYRLLSWSINRPGWVESDTVAWLQVQGSQLPLDVDPRLFLEDKLKMRGDPHAVGLMTARDISAWQQTLIDKKNYWARSFMTLDLGNGSHVGYPPLRRDDDFKPGTINLLTVLSHPLSDAAMLEAVSMATQGRTAALMDLSCQPREAQQLVTGTGTDCIVIASPRASEKHKEVDFVGLHTALGQALGLSVYRVTLKAGQQWMVENDLLCVDCS
ncbi:adenosylcobinamide amidohydrolase [Magnetococcales bacterium HHB-1]